MSLRNRSSFHVLMVLMILNALLPSLGASAPVGQQSLRFFSLLKALSWIAVTPRAWS